MIIVRPYPRPTLGSHLLRCEPHHKTWPKSVSHCRLHSDDLVCCIDSLVEASRHEYGVAQWLSRCGPLSICPSHARFPKLFIHGDSYAEIEKLKYGVTQWLSRCDSRSICPFLAMAVDLVRSAISYQFPRSSTWPSEAIYDAYSVRIFKQ